MRLPTAGTVNGNAPVPPQWCCKPQHPAATHPIAKWVLLPRAPLIRPICLICPIRPMAPHFGAPSEKTECISLAGRVLPAHSLAPLTDTSFGGRQYPSRLPTVAGVPRTTRSGQRTTGAADTNQLEELRLMSSVTMKQLLEAGVHFGHQSRRWNPKMKPYIYTERSKIYIIDLKKTLRLLREATRVVKDCVANGGKVMFVGTKKQAKDIIREGADSCGMYFVNNRWLGGLMTNFQTVRKSTLRMLELEEMFTTGSISKFKKKEQSQLARELEALKKNLDGIRNMERLPDLLFIIDPSKEQIAVQEARKLNIPIVAVVDTNCNPDDADYVIPGNDDAIRSIKLMVGQIAEAAQEGLAMRGEAFGHPVGSDEAMMAEPEMTTADFGGEMPLEPVAAEMPDPPAISPAMPSAEPAKEG